MKRLILSLAVAGAFMLPSISFGAASQAQQNTGCGLGAMFIGDKANDSLLGQLAMTTLNGTLGNQTFGITSGTSNCKKPSRIVMNEKLNRFVEDNMDSLAHDIATGSGESLDTLAELMSVPAEAKAEFYGNLQANFTKIYTSETVQSAEVIDNIAGLNPNS